MNTVKPVGHLGGRAIITVNDLSNNVFHVYLPRNGSPGELARVLKSSTADSFDAGDIMSDILASVCTIVRPTLFSAKDMRTYLGKTDVRYQIARYSSYALVNVSKVQDGKVAEEACFCGNFWNFLNWAKDIQELDAVTMKVVSFRYRGGSHPGETRTIRVEKVGREGTSGWIEGYDLSKPDLARAYKRYLCSRIEGDISVHN